MKKILWLCLVLCLAACATVGNKSANPSKVGFNFQSENGIAALTLWKKLNDDGTTSSAFAIGVTKAKLLMNSSFPKAYTYEEKLDPGYYFMDSYQVSIGGGDYILSENKHYLRRNGWDKENNKPYYLAFRVEEEKDLSLPVVTIIPIPADNRTAFKFNDAEHIFILGTKADKK
ncbi:MAG: hypothetical protein LBK69_06815 [Syntrophomonadaceae bacterium]|jgi:hypothetical protein|nr:hypothetical protein [Syntrophomonadaceae bacterium]